MLTTTVCESINISISLSWSRKRGERKSYQLIPNSSISKTRVDSPGMPGCENLP